MLIGYRSLRPLVTYPSLIMVCSPSILELTLILLVAWRGVAWQVSFSYSFILLVAWRGVAWQVSFLYIKYKVLDIAFSSFALCLYVQMLS